MKKFLAFVVCVVVLFAAGTVFATERFKILQEKAEKGDINAMFLLGGKYFKGEEVEQDYKKAAELWRKAAEKGHAGAQDALKQIGEKW